MPPPERGDARPLNQNNNKVPATWPGRDRPRIRRCPSSRWLRFGNLNNGLANAGLSAGNGNNGLGNANWNIGGRIFEND